MESPIIVSTSDEQAIHDLSSKKVLVFKALSPVDVFDFVVSPVSDVSSTCVLALKKTPLGGKEGPSEATLTVPEKAKAGSIWRNDLAANQKIVKLNTGDTVTVAATTPGSGNALVKLFVRRAPQPTPIGEHYHEVMS
jgi:hypothetical protein